MSGRVVTSTDDYYASLAFEAEFMGHGPTATKPRKRARLLRKWLDQSVAKRFQADDETNSIALDYALTPEGHSKPGSLPTALVMVRRGSHYSFPISWTARTVVIDDNVIVLSAFDAAARLTKTVQALADDFFAGDFFGDSTPTKQAQTVPIRRHRF